MPSDDCDQRVAEARAAGLREATELREALRDVIDRSMPSHSTACASQSDEAECFCETGPAMDRAYAFLAAPGAAPAEGRALDADNGSRATDDPWERQHEETGPGTRRWWRCVSLDAARRWEEEAIETGHQRLFATPAEPATEG